MNTHPDSLPEARAQRLRRLRNLANLSRKEICEQSGIRLDTLIGWEVARHGGLTENGAHKIKECVAKHGVVCTLEWVLYALGEGPTVISNFNVDLLTLAKSTYIHQDEDKQIINELLFFKSNNQDAVELIISDDSMSPYYNVGDYVAGIKRYKDKLHTLIGLDCITQTIDGAFLSRKILLGDEKEKFNLISTNLASKAQLLILQNIDLVYAAPIIWIRRKNNY